MQRQRWAKALKQCRQNWTLLLQEQSTDELTFLLLLISGKNPHCDFGRMGCKAKGTQWSEGRQWAELSLPSTPPRSPASLIPLRWIQPPQHFISQQSKAWRHLQPVSQQLSSEPQSHTSDPKLHTPYPLLLSPPFTEVLFFFSIPAQFGAPQHQPSFVHRALLNLSMPQAESPTLQYAHPPSPWDRASPPVYTPQDAFLLQHFTIRGWLP